MAGENTAPPKPSLLYDGFDILTGGMDSGVAPLSLPLTKISYGTNTTVRGGYVTHRPPYSDINLILDTGVDLDALLFQGACYYDPDFGQQSIVAQIGGRLYQFVPDAAGNAYVYDRTVKYYPTGINFTSQAASQTQDYSVVLTNISDSSGANYPAGTGIATDPSFITSSAAELSMNPVLVNNNTQLQWTGNLLLPADFQNAAGLVGNQVFLAADGVPNQVRWNVIGNGTSGPNPYITIQFTLTGSGQTIVEPSGTPIFFITNPFPPATVGKLSAGFTAPAVGQTVTVSLASAYPGSVGDGILIGGNLYQVSSIPPPTTISSATGQESVSVFTSTQFTYDTNPAGTRQAWLVQAENYVVVTDGESIPIYFNGISSRRAVTPTFSGTLSESFSLPQIGQAVNLTLNDTFKDTVGTFINLTPLNLFPFLMEVTAKNVGGNSSVITAVNITGQTAVNSIIPISTPVNSTASPSYSGITASAPTWLNDGISTINWPPPETQLTIAVSPPFNGNVGDTLIFTDGTGPLTQYAVTVDAIYGGGASLLVTNVNAPQNLVMQIGYPIISQNTAATELPIVRMGAYVQGRLWYSLPSGTAFIAGDQVGDSSGTAALNYRDAVLKWSINTVNFSVPGEAGQINCIVALSSLDASLGQGPLQILCDNDIFTCSASDDATTWAATKSPILAESAIGFGGVGQNAAAVVNGDLILRSNDGTIHSLKLARQDFNQWGNLPVSKEVNRVILQENDDLLPYTTACEVNNRCLISCAPIAVNGVVYSQGLIALDFDVTSSLQGKLPSVYDGVWKDLNIFQIVSGVFNDAQRTFAFCYNSGSNSVQLVELLNQGNFDNGNTLIKWSFETALLFQSANRYLPKRLEGGEIYISNLVGKATIKLWYRPDYDECWHYWTTLQVCADNVQSGPDQYRARLGLGKPTDEECDPTVNKKPRDGRFFQLRIEIEGSCTFMGAIGIGSSQPQFNGGLLPAPPAPEGVGVNLDLNPPAVMSQQQPCHVSTLIYYSNPPVVYINDPNAEGLKPADPTKSCVAYSSTGDGSFFGWEVASQTWM